MSRMERIVVYSLMLGVAVLGLYFGVQAQQAPVGRVNTPTGTPPAVTPPTVTPPSTGSPAPAGRTTTQVGTPTVTPPAAAMPPATGTTAPASRTTTPVGTPAVGSTVATTTAQASATPQTETGLAAIYNSKLQGRKTASGAIFDQRKLTTAHKTLPFGTKVRLTNLENNRSTVVVVNDRGPVQAGRIVDISQRTARELGFGKSMMLEVKLEVVSLPPVH